MIYLLFIFYTVFFCWLIYRLRFFKKSGLSGGVLIVLFLVRIISGIVNGYISSNYYPISDAVEFHKQGLVEYNLLFNNPYEYLTNLFHSNYNSYSNFLESSASFWNDLRTNIITKLLSIFDLFSARDFYINNLFFNFLIFFGGIYLYKVFFKIFPNHRYIIIICIFLLPSLIYFTSGIHRDGIIYLLLSIVIYEVQNILEKKTYPWKKIFSIFVLLSLILLLRNFVIIALLPALIAWLIGAYFRKKALICFLTIYSIATVAFFCSGLLSTEFNLPQRVSLRQIEFIKISERSASAIDIDPLYPSFRGFIHNAPQAFNHSIMRPYLTERGNFFYTPLAIEIFVYEVLIFLFIFYRNQVPIAPFIYFCFFFSLSMFMLIGYTIPITGAIVRYRSIYLPLVVIPITCLINWSRIKHDVTYIKIVIHNIFHKRSEI